MSIFDFDEKDQEDYTKWMCGVREKISQNVNEKSSLYCYNFERSEPIANGHYEWEQVKEPAKRISTLTFMRSTLSTLPTLGEEALEDIPTISDLDLRISQELSVSPIMMLPHKR